MTGLACVGAQWGDEGKGKVVDLLTEQADVIVRFQGGNNAGHTIVVKDMTVVLHTVPSGVLHAGKLNVIGNGVVVDPGVLLNEVEALKAKGFLKNDADLAVSDQAHVILDVHRRVDRAREQQADRKIGTTGRGIGPTYEDKVARRGLRVLDMMKPTWADALRARVASANTTLAGLGAPTVSGQELEELIARTRTYATALKPYARDTVDLMAQQVKAKRNILFEGAQGAMLDVDHGTYPYVTSSSTVSGGACSGSGVGPNAIHHVFGVAKAYCTRVGEGPFPTELNDALGSQLREAGGEYGATTGRPRRCGWFDVVAMRRAVQVNGMDLLGITKLDILSGLTEIKACVAYEVDGTTLNRFPADTDVLARVKPVYQTFEGWSQSVAGARRMEDLPPQAQRYVRWIEEQVQVPLAMVSVGAARGDEFFLRPVF